MWWYLRAYLRSRRLRFGLTIVGLSLALASVFIAYGVAAWVDLSSARALSYVIQGANLWIVPPGGVRLDRHAAAIVAQGVLPAAAIDTVRSIDPAARVRRVAMGTLNVTGRSLVFYAADEHAGAGVLVSPEVWRSVGERPASATLGDKRLEITGMDPDLPVSAARGSFETWAPALPSAGRANWIVVTTDRSRLVGEQVARRLTADFTDSPNLIASGTSTRSTVFLLDASLSRFDPFSFRTKFSSLMLNATLSTVFGWVARFIFLIGMGLATTSALMGVQEKRHEIGLLAALGHQSGITLLLLSESVLLSAISCLVGFALAMATLASAVDWHYLPRVGGPSFVMGALYCVLLVIVSPLVAAQRIASRRAIDLIRETNSL